MVPSPGPVWAVFKEPFPVSSAIPSEDEPHAEDSQRELMAEPMRKRKTSTHGSVAQRKPPKMPRLNQGEAPQAGPSSMPRDSRIDMNRKHVYTGRESSSALDISNARLSSTQPIVIPKALSRPSLSQAISSAKTRVKRKKNGKEKQNNSRLSSSSPDLPENISADFERMKKYQVDKSSVDSVNAPAGEKGKRRPTYHSAKGSKPTLGVPSFSINHTEIKGRKSFPSTPVIILLSSDDEPPDTHSSKLSVKKPIGDTATRSNEAIDLTLDTDNEASRKSLSRSRLSTSIPSPRYPPTIPSGRVREDGVISLSDDDMLLQSPKICCSPVVSLHSTTSVLATNYGDSVSNHDAQDTPSEIPDPAEEARLGPVLNNAPYSDIDTESPVDMVPPELSIEPQYSSEATTILTDKPNSVSQPLESPHVPSTADNCNDATIWNPSTDVLALNTVSQQAIGLGRHASPLSPSDGGNIIPVVQDETARCSTSPDAFDYSLAGYDLEPGHRDSTQPELSLVDNIITAPPPTNILTSAQHDVGTNPIGNDHPACEPSNHIRCLAGTLTDELLPMYGPSSPEAPRPRRCVPVEVNGPFVYTDRIFAWMDKRVQRHSIIRDSAARRGLDVSVRNPIPGAMERPPSNANSNDISVENEVMTPSDSLHGAVIVSSPSRLQVKIGHLQTLLEQRELLVATTELGVTSQSQPSPSLPRRPLTRRSSLSGPAGSSLTDVINRAREQYDKTKATLVACSNCSTPLTKPLTIDLTDDNSNNNNCGPTDNGLQDAIASSEQLMTLLELAVPSLERELGRGTSMKASQQTEPPLSPHPTQNMAPIARSDSNSRESSVSGPKKLPTLDEIRSIRKLVKRNTDGKTKPFTPMNPLVSKKTFREGSGSPVADLQLLTRESSSTDRTLASNIDSDKPYTSAPFTSSSLVPAAHSPTRCVEVNGQIGLSPPMPADHRSTRSAQRISDQEQLNLLDIVTDSRDPSMFDLGYREPRSTEFISSLPNEQGSALPTMDSVAPKPRPSIGIDHISPLNIKPSLADNKNMAVDNTAPVDPQSAPQPISLESPVDSDDGELSAHLIYPDDTELSTDDTPRTKITSASNAEVLNKAHEPPFQYGSARGLLQDTSFGLTSHQSSGQSSRFSSDTKNLLGEGNANRSQTRVINRSRTGNGTPNGFASVMHRIGSHGFPIITWKDIREAARKSNPKYYLAKDLPHDLQDYMNALDPSYREMSMSRTIFEANIIENTMDDEPDAPPIRIINEIDDEPTPLWEFHYSNQMWHGEGVPPPNILNLISCDCEGGSCDPRSKTCACLQRQRKYTSECTPDFAYDHRGRLKHDEIPIFECNDLCGCDEKCRNRVVQHGRKWAVNIAKTREKGWGVFAGSKRIPSGSFVGIYAGELLTDAVGEERGFKYNKFGRTYLFDIDFHVLKQDNKDWKNMYVVDAYHAGNFTRYLNHSCDPNCSLNACYINESNIDKPQLAVFTRRDVEPGEELCFSYSGLTYDGSDDDSDNDEPPPKDADAAIFVPCRCGATRCTGVMFK